MLEEINISKYFNLVYQWIDNTFHDPDVLTQLFIIAACVIAAGFIYVVIKRKLQKKIDGSEMPIRAKRIATNLRRLLLPTLALIFIFISSIIAASESIGLNIALNFGVMQVLMAWIVVRISVQFIENSLVRNIFSIGIWIVLALSIFGVLEQTTATLDAVGFNIGEFRVSALAIIKGIFALFALLYLAIFVSTFAERRILQIKSLNRSSQVLVAKVMRVTLVVVALLIGVTSAGIDLSLFAVFGGAVGLGIGFGLQKGISNLFSGMLLLLDRSIKPGDVIEIPDIGTFGWVNEMAARYTEIVTRDNKSFLITNEDFITQRVVNWSHGNSLIRISVDFGVHYNSDPEEVIAVAIDTAQKPKRVVDTREPVCWITEFGDSSVNFTLRFWIKDAENGLTNVRGEVLLELWKAFKKHDIQIPYPHREVYFHNPPEDTDNKSIVVDDDQEALSKEKPKEEKTKKEPSKKKTLTKKTSPKKKKT